MTISKILKSEEETRVFAFDFAKNLKGGEIICLSGELGAGKTVFVKGLAQGLGISGIVRSPSFLIMRVYKANRGKIKKFCHIDAYRLAAAEELETIGSQEFLGEKISVCAIEWPENVNNLLKKRKVILIEIKILDNDKRKITVKI